MLFNPLDYTTVFLSYDEPNCEENYRHLLSLNPQALRVHGVKGSDTAHKEVAKLSKSLSVIIVDADNIVKPSFFTTTIDLKDDVDLSTCVLSYCGNNNLNGLVYGNGGIKVWPVSLLESMKTHENSTEANTNVDFDFTKYLQLNTVGSDVNITSSKCQAFRSGFREGVKLCLNDGEVKYTIDNLDWRNYDRLWSWMHVGSDVENGLFAIYGARLGAYYVSTGFDYNQVQDFDYIEELFENIPLSVLNDLAQEANRLGHLLRLKTNDNRIKDVLTKEESIQYKQGYTPLKRSPETFLKQEASTTYDIVFISYNESHAEENYNRLSQKVPEAKRVHGVKGIHQAHIEAAKLCTTDYFWVVDADAILVDSFNFDYVVPFYDYEKVRVWRSKNSVNGLVYGYGGVKLLPRTSTLRMRTDKPDMTTSICRHYEPIFELSNITKIDTDPFNTWRSAFRECCKLASNTIDDSKATRDRLIIWCNMSEGPYKDEAIRGAREGRLYGQANSNDLEALRKINDFDWMEARWKQS